MILRAAADAGLIDVTNPGSTAALLSFRYLAHTAI